MWPTSPRRRRRTALLVGLLLLVTSAGCGRAPDPDALAETITADDLARMTRTLASDRLRGRGPATEGERLTLEYLVGEFERIGLEPRGDAGDEASPTWLQRVPVARITADPEGAELRIEGGAPAFSYGDDYITWTRHEQETVRVEAPLVFAGYGVVAPEEDWNDYSADLAGAVVVLLVNDPPVAGRFGDEAMTYYGRWTYKYEEAARQGAVGALIVHQTGPAGYGWSVVRSSWSGPQFHLPPGPDEPPPARIEGWLSESAAAALFEAAGLDLPALIEAAAEPGFAPVDLGLSVALGLDNRLDRIVSHNVVGGLPGRSARAADEHVVWTAHWDHLGEDPGLQGDTIYNGALDNATGVAALLEIAEAFAAADSRTRRSHLFVATTLEEKGLLGATWYAAHPLVEPALTVGAINIDGLNVWGPTADMTVIGLGNSELDDLLVEVLADQGRRAMPDPEPDKGFFYRSDHFPLARVGVPALYTDAGVDYVGRPDDYGSRVRRQYTQRDYHRPSDEFDPGWDFAGAELDVRALFRVGFRLADGDAWPAWSGGSEFRAIRERSLAALRADGR